MVVLERDVPVDEANNNPAQETIIMIIIEWVNNRAQIIRLGSLKERDIFP